MKCDLCDKNTKDTKCINHVNLCDQCLKAFTRIKSKTIKAYHGGY